MNCLVTNKTISIEEAEREKKIKALFTPKGEFETTKEYEARTASAKVEEARIRKEYDARIKEETWKEERRLKEEREKFYPYTLPLSLSRYDADASGFEAGVSGNQVFIPVPREKAIEISKHKDNLDIQGMVKYYDSQNVELVNAYLVDKTSGEKFAFGKHIKLDWEGFAPADAKEWKDKGFSPSEALAWKKIGISSDAAAQWSKAKISPAAVAKWSKAGFDANAAAEWTIGFEPAKAKEWRAGFKNANEALQWKNAGFDVATARSWKERGFDPERAKGGAEGGGFTGASARKEQAIKNNCPKGVSTVQDLWQTNPYDVAGRCYEFTGATLQILGRSIALFTISDRVFYIDFGNDSAPPTSFIGVVKGTGVYQYATARGSMNTVPKMKVLKLE